MRECGQALASVVLRVSNALASGMSCYQVSQVSNQLTSNIPNVIGCFNAQTQIKINANLATLKKVANMCSTNNSESVQALNTLVENLLNIAYNN